MRLQAKIIGVASVSLLLAACGTADIANMPVKGGAFEQGLRDGYINLADSEYDQTDIGSGNVFSDRAKMSAMGTPPTPEVLAARKLVAPHLAELTGARSRLVSALSNEAARKAATDAAAAQVSFDCWMEQAEENIQPDHIAACRSDFMAAMSRIDAALMPKVAAAKPAPKKKARKPQTSKYVVYFDHNSATLNKAAMNGIDFVKGEVKKGAKISVAAFTDRSGTPAYNNILATKRANTVVYALEKAGVKGDISTDVYGEERNAVATKEGVREKLNRRVEIYVTQ